MVSSISYICLPSMRRSAHALPYFLEVSGSALTSRCQQIRQMFSVPKQKEEHTSSLWLGNYQPEILWEWSDSFIMSEDTKNKIIAHHGNIWIVIFTQLSQIARLLLPKKKHLWIYQGLRGLESTMTRSNWKWTFRLVFQVSTQSD